MAGSNRPRVLLVEGVDDAHVVRHLCGHPDQPDMPAFGILNKEGLDNLLSAIGPEVKVPGRLAVGILADANDDPNARWKEIAGRLRKAGVETPDRLDSTGGVVVTGMVGRPRVGVWLMPDNGSEGELEDFVEKLIPEGDPVWPLAERYVGGIPLDARRFKPGKFLRARIHAWLATRAEPRKMGAAIGVGDLDAAAPLANTFADWLRGVFGRRPAVEPRVAPGRQGPRPPRAPAGGERRPDGA